MSRKRETLDTTKLNGQSSRAKVAGGASRDQARLDLSRLHVTDDNCRRKPPFGKFVVEKSFGVWVRSRLWLYMHWYKAHLLLYLYSGTAK